jgi:hypothetical protein
MHRSVVRVLLLVLSMLFAGALPALAQSESEASAVPAVTTPPEAPATSSADKGWLLTSDDDKAIVAIRRDVTVGPTESVDGLVSVDGTVTVEGAVKNLFAVDADVTVTGSSAKVDHVFIVGGSLQASAGTTLGDVYYSDTDLSIGDATLTGKVADAKTEFTGALAALAAVLLVILLFLAVGVFVASLALTLLVIAFGTDQVRRAGANIGGDVLKTIVVGLLMLIVPGIIIGLLFVTIVGAPLAIALALLWGVVFFLGMVVVATWIGERILPRGRAAARPYGSAFLGMLILLLLWWTGIVPLLVSVFGLGAVTLTGWRVLRSGGQPPAPPMYGWPTYGQPMQPPPQMYPPPYAPPPPPGQWPPQGGPPPGSWQG